MKVVMLQTDISWAKPEENIRHAQQLMDEAPDGDLYVLPEMWSTGFATQPEGIASNEADNKALEWMRQTAQERKCAISGSLAVKVGDGTFRNRHYFVDGRAGETYYYDKHHLFTYGGEDKQFTAGQERVVVEYGGIRFLLQVCYDLRFPVFSRNKGDYDVAIYVASWPVTRVKAWSQLLRARAIENQCYVIGVNRTGTDPVCQYNGGSAVISPYGETIAECEWGTEMTCCADIDMDVLYNFRKKFPVLNDADGFQLT